MILLEIMHSHFLFTRTNVIMMLLTIAGLAILYIIQCLGYHSRIHCVTCILEAIVQRSKIICTHVLAYPIYTNYFVCLIFFGLVKNLTVIFKGINDT